MEEERDKATIAEQLVRARVHTRERAPLSRTPRVQFLIAGRARIPIDEDTAACLDSRSCIMLSLRRGIQERGRVFTPFQREPWRWYLVPYWWRWTIALGYGIAGEFVAERAASGLTWEQWPSQIHPTRS